MDDNNIFNKLFEIIDKQGKMIDELTSELRQSNNNTKTSLDIIKGILEDEGINCMNPDDKERFKQSLLSSDEYNTEPLPDNVLPFKLRRK